MSNNTFHGICQPFEFGPIESSGFFTICFIDLCLTTLTLLLMVLFGSYRLYKVSQKENVYQERTKIHLFVLLISFCQILLVASQSIYYFIYYFYIDQNDEQIPYFELYLFGGLLLTWISFSVLVELEYTRGLKYSITVLLFWILSAFFNCLRIQAYIDAKIFNFSFYFILCELVICIILCSIVFVSNKSHLGSKNKIDIDAVDYRFAIFFFFF
jgi:hypothetical protein